jgi:hypothetical protein
VVHKVALAKPAQDGVTERRQVIVNTLARLRKRQQRLTAKIAEAREARLENRAFLATFASLCVLCG